MLSFFSKDLEKYINLHSEEEPPLLAELREYTQKNTDLPQMLSGNIVGRLLKLLITLTRSKNILEIGTFTGYASLSMAEACFSFGGRVTTLEYDPDTAKKAEGFFTRSAYSNNITQMVGPALESLEKLDGPFDFVFVDADKVNYKNYFEQVMTKVKPGALFVFDNCLWSGSVLKPEDESSQAIHSLNQTLKEDPRVENIILSVRDGLHLAHVK